MVCWSNVTVRPLSSIKKNTNFKPAWFVVQQEIGVDNYIFYFKSILAICHLIRADAQIKIHEIKLNKQNKNLNKNNIKR